MRKPVLLSGQTMTPAGILNPLTMSLTLMADDMSTASMTLDSDSPAVKCGNWVQIWAPNGTMCVMYIKNLRTDYNTDIRTIELEHCFALLEETVLFGEVTPATMGGSATSVSATKAITYLLNRQSTKIWTIGSCDFSTSTGWEFTNSNILSGLQDIAAAIQDCQWEFDQTALPWKLSLKKWPTAATMELRNNRNLRTLKITLDRTGMYTRVWPVGNKNLDISSVNGGKKYLDMNTGTWGIIGQVITDSSITSAAHLKAWGEAQLKKNAEPRITASIDALELSKETGESLDKIIMGRLCRVPLPEYGTTVTRRVSSLSWANCCADEYAVSVTLANEHKTISGLLKEKANSGSSGGRKSGAKTGKDLKDDEEQLQEFENSDIWINRDNVWAVSAQYDVYTDTDGKRHIRLRNGALLEVERDGGIYATVGDLVGEYDKHNLKTDRWVDSFEGSALWTQRNQITGVCGEYDIEYYTDASGKRQKRLIVKSGGGMKIRRNNVEYGLYDEGNLTGGLMVQKINGQTTTYLKGDIIKIGNSGLVTVLDGKLNASAVTADYIASKIAQASSITATALTVTGTVTAGDYRVSTSGGYAYLKNAGFSLGITLDSATNVYTLTMYNMEGNEKSSVTFSRATALSGAWSGSTSSGKYYKVTASPQGNTKSSDSVTAVTSGSKSWASDNKSFTITIKAVAGGTTDLYSKSFEFDTTTSYTAGVNYAKPVSWTAGSQGSLSQFTAKATSTGGGSASKTYYLVKNGNYVEVREGSQTGTRVARISA